MWAHLNVTFLSASHSWMYSLFFFFSPLFMLFRLCFILYSNKSIKSAVCTKQRSEKLIIKAEEKKNFFVLFQQQEKLFWKNRVRKNWAREKRNAIFSWKIERNWPQCIVVLLLFFLSFYQKLNMLGIFYAFYKYFNSYRLSSSFFYTTTNAFGRSQRCFRTKNMKSNT